ncbi:MAG TPA: DUF2752 domain-containing protein [Bacteroidia bacterium]|jgi:hypothetical protein|nr:DUF2752 domain-containing protein [Bacteroidia bacterium]
MLALSIRHRISARDLSTILLSAGLVVVYFLPSGFLFNGQVFCLHKNLLGFDCPACGMTRALHCLLHGQFLTAITFNVGVVALVVLVVQHYLSYFIVAEISEVFRKIAAWLFAATLLLVYLVRTIEHFI